MGGVGVPFISNAFSGQNPKTQSASRTQSSDLAKTQTAQPLLRSLKAKPAQAIFFPEPVQPPRELVVSFRARSKASYLQDSTVVLLRSEISLPRALGSGACEDGLSQLRIHPGSARSYSGVAKNASRHSHATGVSASVGVAALTDKTRSEVEVLVVQKQCESPQAHWFFAPSRVYVRCKKLHANSSFCN